MGRSFDLAAEVARRRQALLEKDQADGGDMPMPLPLPNGAEDIWGLALSGGGIRSATFCLGVLRALADNELLKRFDVLSTVSGGGYVGSMLGRLFMQPKGVGAVVKALRGTHTSWFMWWLRANGRYLVPTGVADTVFALAIYLRNLVAIHLEFGILALLLGGLLAGFDLLAWWGLQAWAWHSSALFAYLKWLPSWLPTVWLLLPAVLLCSAVSAAAHWSLTWMVRATAWRTAVNWVLVCAAWLLLNGLYAQHGQVGVGAGHLTRNGLWIGISLLLLTWLGGVPLAAWQLHSARKSCDGHVQLVVEEARSRLTQRLAGCFKCLAFVVLVGLIDRLAWLLAFDVRNPIQTGLGLGLLVAASRAVLPKLAQVENLGLSQGVLAPLLNAAGFLAVLVLASWWVSLVYQAVLGAVFWGDGPNFHAPLWVLAGLVCPIAIYSLLTGRNFSFLNLSSLHSFYKARLVRTYLGATNPERFPLKEHGHDSPLQVVPMAVGPSDAKVSVQNTHPDDDVEMMDYCPQQSGGPVHLINVCLNQTVGPRGHIFNHDRKGQPLCIASGGFMRVGQDPWQELAASQDLTLGTWMAISGAAVASGMGAMTRGGMAALTTLTGLRLGYWWSPASGYQGSHWFSKLSGVLSETFGTFGGKARQDWYLSDGGHFENTGAYALLAARAKVIVLVDCGADPNYQFGDLENLVRKARIDLQAEILFQRKDESRATNSPEWRDFGSLDQLASESANECLAVATVIYDGKEDEPGLLVVIKPNVCSRLPVDLRNYKRANAAFPQQSTADQFFSEEQWESYYSLGRFLGSHLNQGLINKLRQNDSPFVQDEASQVRRCRPDELSSASTPGPMSTLRTPSKAMASTLSLSAAATIGVSAWQGLEGWRAAIKTSTDAQRAALGELSALWARLPLVAVAPAVASGATSGGASVAGPAMDSGTTGALAAILVRHADTLCPGGEAGWFQSSPLAQTIYQNTLQACKLAAVSGRPVSCQALLKMEDPQSNSPFPACLATYASQSQYGGAETRGLPVVYGVYDYSARPKVDLRSVHPCDPRAATNCQPAQVSLPLMGEGPRPAPMVRPGPTLQIEIKPSHVCEGKTIYIQIYGPNQRDAVRLLRDPWRALGASVPPIDDVRATSAARGSQAPLPVSVNTVRFHTWYDKPCAEALERAARGAMAQLPSDRQKSVVPMIWGDPDLPWRVEPLSPKLQSTQGVIEVWIRN